MLVVYTSTGWCEGQQKSHVNEAAALTSTCCEIINAVIFYKKAISWLDQSLP